VGGYVCAHNGSYVIIGASQVSGISKLWNGGSAEATGAWGYVLSKTGVVTLFVWWFIW